MKKLIIAGFLLTALSFTSCDKNDEPSGNDKPGNEITTPDVPATPSNPSNGNNGDKENVKDFGTYKMVETKDNIKIVPKDERPILALFVRKGCPWSQKFWPAFDLAAEEEQYKGINFIKIWTDDYTTNEALVYLGKLKTSYDLTGTPNMIIIDPEGNHLTTIHGEKLGIKEDVDFFIAYYLKKFL